MPELAPAVKEELQGGDIACNQSADDDDSLDEGILDEGRQLTPVDDLASPEDSYFLEFECTGGQAEKMVLSPPRPQEKRVHLRQTSCTQTSNTCPDGTYYTVNESKTQLSVDDQGNQFDRATTNTTICVGTL